MSVPFSLHETQEKEGFLNKRGGGTFGAKYQKRWFILHDMELYYFKNKPVKGKGELSGVINLKDCELSDEEEPGMPFSFSITVKAPAPRQYWIKADTKLIKKDWILALAQKLKKDVGGGSTVAISEMSNLKMTHDDVITGIKAMYFDKMLDLETRFMYDEFFSPLLKRSDLESKPMILLLGQYSVGKTSFIEYLLKQPFPGSNIGPEPTTDRFMAVMHGDEDRVIPGNALSVDPEKPFSSVNKFGTGFLTKFEASLTNCEMLKKVTFIDTPGVLSGEKQRIGRDYDFPEVVKYFAQTSDIILLLFDAHKLDISDEFKSAILALKGNDEKIRVVLNKADSVTTQQLVRVYGSLMWSLGKVINTPEVMRVYIGSFWSKPYKNAENEKLFRAEQQDLIDDLNTLPRNSAVRKVNELVKRARTLRAHMLILNHLRKQMPALVGKEKKQKDLIANLATEFQEISRLTKVPLGDFPKTEIYEKVLPDKDFTKFPQLTDKMLLIIEEILTKDLPNYMQMASPQGTEKVESDYNPFENDDGDDWAVPLTFQEECIKKWNAITPSNEPQSGAQLKIPLMESRAPQESLKKIWTLADIGKRGKLDRDEFILALWLANMAKEGQTIPDKLPDNLIPPSKKKDTLFSQ